MQTIIKSATVALLLALPSGAAWAMDAQQLAIGLCTATAVNDATEFRSKLRDAGTRLRNVYDGVNCNGVSLLRFAAQENAGDVAALMVKRVSKSTLSNPEGDGMTALAWMEANGFGDSAVAEAIRERL